MIKRCPLSLHRCTGHDMVLILGMCTACSACTSLVLSNCNNMQSRDGPTALLQGLKELPLLAGTLRATPLQVDLACQLELEWHRGLKRTTSGSLLIFSSGTAGTICALGSSAASRPPMGACILHTHSDENVCSRLISGHFLKMRECQQLTASVWQVKAVMQCMSPSGLLCEEAPGMESLSLPRWVGWQCIHRSDLVGKG